MSTKKSFDELSFATTAIAEMRQFNRPQEVAVKWAEDLGYTAEELREFVGDDRNFKRLGSSKPIDAGAYTYNGYVDRTPHWKLLMDRHRAAINYYFGFSD